MARREGLRKKLPTCKKQYHPLLTQMLHRAKSGVRLSFCSVQFCAYGWYTAKVAIIFIQTI